MIEMSEQQFDLIVFDWDGTLSDSTGLIAECIQLAARDLAFKVPTLVQAKSIIGLGLLQSTSTLFPELSEADRTRFAARFREHYVPRDHEATLYDGVRELLPQLQRPKRFLAVATGKPRVGLERAFERTQLKAHFHFSRCGDEGMPKPDADMLLRLMEFANVAPARTLMIGDTTHDLDLAHNAGVSVVGVAYGAHSRAMLSSRQSSAIVENVTELTAWLTQNG
jgi:phosphoglycolate phosphatase